jgi:uncharacterized protein YcfJ
MRGHKHGSASPNTAMAPENGRDIVLELKDVSAGAFSGSRLVKTEDYHTHLIDQVIQRCSELINQSQSRVGYGCKSPQAVWNTRFYIR